MKTAHKQPFKDTKDWYYSLPKRKPDGSEITDGYNGPVVRWNGNAPAYPKDLIDEFNKKSSSKINKNKSSFDEDETDLIANLESL